MQVAETESVRKTDRAEVFVSLNRDVARQSRQRSRLDKGGSFRCVRGPTRTRPVATGLEQYAGVSMLDDIV